MKPEYWRRITQVAAGQAGLITASQLRLAGASPPTVARAVAEGALVPVRNRVYVLAGVPNDMTRATRAVTLVTPHAVVSHRSAAWLHGLMSKPPPKVEVIIPPRRLLNLKGVDHVEAVVTATDTCERHGIPVTTVARTLVDLWARLPADWSARLVHESVTRRLCQYADIRAAAARAGVLDFVGEGEGTTALEFEWDRALRKAGMPEPVRQHQVVVGGHVYLLDFAWPSALVALEVNGFIAHRTREAFDRDHEKTAALQAAGWAVVSATARTRRTHVLTALRRLLQQSTSPADVDC